MRAILTDEQQLLLSTVTALATGAPQPVPEPGTVLDARGWDELADLGLLDVRPGVDGALGGVDAALVGEALAGALSPLPYLGCCVAPTALLAEHAPDHPLLAEIAAGRRVALALDHRFRDLADLDTEQGVAVDAAGAEVAIARRGDRLVLVGTGGRVTTIDPTRSALAVDVAAIGETIGAMRRDSHRWRTAAIVALCADMVGVMAAALRRAIAYASDRRQFGKAIGTFQAVQHLCAEQHVRVEASRSITSYAAWALDRLDGIAAYEAARAAKVYVGEAGRAVTEAAIQIHGGIGVTWECDLHLHLRRVTIDGALLGSPSALVREAAERFR